MELIRQSQLLRSHLLKMAALSHRAVDYSIKAFQVGDLEFSRLVRFNEHEWRSTLHSIGERGRTLSAAGVRVDADSPAACRALRVYSALRITHLAATEISYNAMLIKVSGRAIAEEGIRPMGRFVNGLVALYTVALFNMEMRHVQAILGSDAGRQWFYGLLKRTEKDLFRQTSAHARFELTIAKSLGQIADQAYEIAGAFRSCFDDEDCLGASRTRRLSGPNRSRNFCDGATPQARAHVSWFTENPLSLRRKLRRQVRPRRGGTQDYLDSRLPM